MKKIIIALIVSLSVFVVFITNATSTSAEELNLISNIEITGQNSFRYNATNDYDGSNIVNFNTIMSKVFQAGANANWQLTIQLTMIRLSVNSFSMLLSNLWEWNEDYNSLEIETTNATNSLIYESIAPPNIITSNTFPATTGYITYITITAFGYDLTNFIMSFQNNGYSQGYNDGYSAGLTQGNNQGYNEGYIQGETNGYNQGYNEGYIQGSDSEGNSLYDMILAVVDTPFRVFDYIFDFEVLGINIKNIVLSFATVAIAIFVIKRFI